jgi:hypothetical protein
VPNPCCPILTAYTSWAKGALDQRCSERQTDNRADGVVSAQTPPQWL